MKGTGRNARGVVDEFVEIYEQEQALKARRIALAFPPGP